MHSRTFLIWPPFELLHHALTTMDF
ncbi:hypothetical protein TNCV_2308361, partial [Trichonephila clavipes]